MSYPMLLGLLLVDISEIIVGSHALKMVVVDSLGQESRLSAIIHHTLPI